MRRIVVVTSAVLLAVSLGACAASESETDVVLRTDAVAVGSIDETISAIGVVASDTQVNLIFEQPGLVDEVYVAVGDSVSVGEPLVQLDDRLFSQAVDQAEVAVQLAELDYERLFVPPSDSQVAAARAAVNSAYLAYQQVLESIDQETLDNAQEQRDQAQQAVDDAQAALEQAEKDFGPDADLILDPLRDQLHQAEIYSWISDLQLQQLYAGPDSSIVDTARAGLAQAQAELARLLEEPDDLAIRRAELQIEQVQLNLDRVLLSLEDLTLTAPVDGVVGQINVQEGAIAPSGQAAIVIVNPSELYVSVDVDEVDIGRVLAGQPVNLSFDAFPDDIVTGAVTDVSVAPMSFLGIVSYQARVDLDENDLLLRAGMSASVDIIVQRHEDVLIIPNWAVRYDRETGQAYASIQQEDGTLAEVPVELGLRNDTFSEVLDGLDEGQIIAVDLSRQTILNEFLDE